MTEQAKAEVIEELELDIKFGFENEQELFESMCDMLYDEEHIDEDWIKKLVAQKYRQHEIESKEWTHPTDFDKLAKAFDELTMQKIVCLHNAGYTKQDGEFDGFETIEELERLGIKAIGFCYYHRQDLMRAVDSEERNLYLGFDSVSQIDYEAFKIANTIINVLNENGLQTTWPGTVDQRIRIENINWQKRPDDQDWSKQRVIRLLTNTNKRPFWKFW